MSLAQSVVAIMALRARLHDLRDDWQLTLLGLAVLVTTVLLVLRRGSAVRWLAFVAAALFWLAVNGAVEGPTLVHVVRRHGMTLGDLLPALLAIMAGAVTLHRKRARDT